METMMMSMEVQVDVSCCKSVGTDLSMLDIEDFLSQICQLKKEVASLEAKLRERGEKLQPEHQDSMCGVRAQRFRDTQNSDLSLTLLCYTDAQDHQSSEPNAGEQQTTLKMCSIRLEDCRNLIQRTENITEEEEDQRDQEEDDGDNDENGKDDDDDNDDEDNNDDEFIPADDNIGSSDEEAPLTSKDKRKSKKSFSCTSCGKAFACQRRENFTRKSIWQRRSFTVNSAGRTFYLLVS
nr:glutamic acid-rich protein-like isoform X2 [Danio rerio]|eukprot:XP_009292951.1 glutamic acid-rich protein-like isoform X2 [Danio rerio]